MEINKLFEVLTLVDSVKTNRWNDVQNIVAAIKESKVDIKEKKWGDGHKEQFADHYALDLSEIKTWSTYEGECIDITFTHEDGRLVCYVRIYEGGCFNGERKALRFTATLWLPKSFIYTIEGDITHALNRMAEYGYEDYLDNQKKLWILNFKSNIIGVAKEVDIDETI